MSNDVGERQKLGNAWKTTFFTVYISAVGNAGSVLDPPGVHLLMTSTAKIAVFASVCVTVLATGLRPSFLFSMMVCRASSVLIRLTLSISLEGNGSLRY